MSKCLQGEPAELDGVDAGGMEFDEGAGAGTGKSVWDGDKPSAGTVELKSCRGEPPAQSSFGGLYRIGLCLQSTTDSTNLLRWLR